MWLILFCKSKVHEILSSNQELNAQIVSDSELMNENIGRTICLKFNHNFSHTESTNTSEYSQLKSDKESDKEQSENHQSMWITSCLHFRYRYSTKIFEYTHTILIV